MKERKRFNEMLEGIPELDSFIGGPIKPAIPETGQEIAWETLNPELKHWYNEYLNACGIKVFVEDCLRFENIYDLEMKNRIIGQACTNLIKERLLPDGIFAIRTDRIMPGDSIKSYHLLLIGRWADISFESYQILLPEVIKEANRILLELKQSTIPEI